MRHIPWIPVVEKLPEERTVVIFSRAEPNGLYRNFAGWLQDGSWRAATPDQPLGGEIDGIVDMGDLRATDYWLAIPKWDPDSNVYDGAWPA